MTMMRCTVSTQGAAVLSQYRLASEHPIQALLLKPLPLLLFYLGPALALPFGAWLAIWRRYDAGARQFRCPISRKSRFLLLVVAAIFVGLALPIYLPFSALRHRLNRSGPRSCAGGDALIALVASRGPASRRVPGAGRTPDLFDFDIVTGACWRPVAADFPATNDGAYLVLWGTSTILIMLASSAIGERAGQAPSARAL